MFIEINKNNYQEKDIREVLKKIYTKNNKLDIFILIFMEGCGPCNETRPEWNKLKNILSNIILQDPNIIILSIDKDYFNKLRNIGNSPNSFPTIRYIKIKNKKILQNENYEDSNIEIKDRTIDSFIYWIKHKLNKNKITKNEIGNIKTTKNITNKKRKYNRKYGGKWSLKYKRSINCNNPRGFSQKQYCKYGRLRI
jgi:hypothetical protein